MPLTGGRVRIALGQPILLLHTTGARSGQPRVNPLLFTPLADGRIVLVASKAGALKHPAWFHNLKAHPEVRVEIRGRPRRCARTSPRARSATAMWATANDNYSGYAKYQERAGDRVIPVVVLTP